MIIGLTGKNASGKGEVAAYLQKNGFVYFSLSDELRAEAKEKSIKPTRENLIKLGNELREKFGASYLAKKINEKIKNFSSIKSISYFLYNEKIMKNKSNFVVDSIRNLEEIKELRKNEEFILIAVDAPIELRFNRAVKRGREGDAKTLEEFKKLEEMENFKNKAGQQLNECVNAADKLIINDGTLKDLYKKIDLIIKWQEQAGKNIL